LRSSTLSARANCLNRAGHWRILVGTDAHAIDAAVRADPLGTDCPTGLDIAGLVAGPEAP
jgi:hypothetical protein